MTAIILRGDARELPLPDGSVDLIVTSPPYFGQRDYRDGGESLAGQIGSEDTPREYVAALLECTREWVRVLKPGGSMFVNLGDKYAGGGMGGHGGGRLNGQVGKGALAGGYGRPRVTGVRDKSLVGLPWRYALGCMDDLGLILRRDIIWHKSSSMPESVTDRCRTSHEYLFHFTAQPRYYSAIDEIREAHTMRPQRRPGGHVPRQQLGVLPAQTHSTSQRDEPGVDGHPLGKLPGPVWEIASQPLSVPGHLGLSHYAAFPMELPRRIILGWSPPGICTACGEGRRPAVTSISLDMSRPQARRAQILACEAGLTEEHFEALLAVGISDTGRGAATQAGRNTPETRALAAHARSALGGYAREYLLRRPAGLAYVCACTPCADHPERRGKDVHAGTDAARGMNDGNGGERYRRYVAELASPRPPRREYHLDDWTPAPARPAVVVDPFGGTGTTSLVADVLGRTGISIDRSADYCRLARWRTTDPGERAKALQVPKPPPVPAGQDSLFDDLEAS